MHKGNDCWGRPIGLTSSLDALNHHDWDVCLLQEVCGHTLDNFCHGKKIQVAYGFTRVSNRSHFGNAIISRVGRLLYQSNDSISASFMEHRRLLRSSLFVGGVEINLCCTHFGLRKVWRAQQCSAVLKELDLLGSSSCRIIGGDFNDKGHSLSESFSRRGLHGIYPQHGHSLKTFPAQYPVLPLDRIYASGELSGSAKLLMPVGQSWHRYSDHLPIVASLTINAG